MSGVEEAAFRSQPIEHTLVPERVEGRVPPEIVGTFLRNGPGLLQVGPDTLNFFDGHALIAGLSFDRGALVFRSRFVRTPLYAEETGVQHMTRRRVFTNLPSRWANLFALDFGNSAMHDVYAWGGKVYAGNDPGHFALDARTLATLGPATWGTEAKARTEMSPMPYRDPVDGTLVGWLKRPGGPRPDRLQFVELDPSGAIVRRTPWFGLGPPPALVHDHRATERWYVATEQAMGISVPAMLWGAKTPWESFTYPGRPATLLLAPRDGQDRLVTLPLPGVTIAFHIVNAFEDGEHVVVDLVTYDGPIDFSSAVPAAARGRGGRTPFTSPDPTPVRFVVDPEREVLVRREPLGTVPGEAPEVDDRRMGRPYRYAWLTSRGAAEPFDRGAYFFFAGITKLDTVDGSTASWTAGRDALVSPPAFVPRAPDAAEDDGWVLAWVLEGPGDELEASVVVLDARDVAAGPVARVHLGVRLPGVSHVRWAAGSTFDAP